VDGRFWGLCVAGCDAARFSRLSAKPVRITNHSVLVVDRDIIARASSPKLTAYGATGDNREPIPARGVQRRHSVAQLPADGTRCSLNTSAQAYSPRFGRISVLTVEDSLRSLQSRATRRAGAGSHQASRSPRSHCASEGKTRRAWKFG